MKLAKNLSIAATGVALALAVVSAKPAQAASVDFVGQSSPGTYNYDIVPNQPNEQLAGGSFIAISGLVDVTQVTGFNPSYLNGFILDPTNVALILKKANTAIGNAFTGLNFSIISSSPTPGSVTFAILNGNNSVAAGNTTGPAVPEPLTIGGTLLAIGFGVWMKRKTAESLQKAE